LKKLHENWDKKSILTYNLPYKIPHCPPEETPLSYYLTKILISPNPQYPSCV